MIIIKKVQWRTWMRQSSKPFFSGLYHSNHLMHGDPYKEYIVESMISHLPTSHSLYHLSALLGFQYQHHHARCIIHWTVPTENKQCSCLDNGWIFRWPLDHHYQSATRSKANSNVEHNCIAFLHFAYNCLRLDSIRFVSSNLVSFEFHFCL